MAFQNAKGNRGTTAGPVKTPAPDEVSHVRSPSGQGYGQNGPANPSSVPPGQRVLSPLAANLESSVDDDGALGDIIRNGTAKNAKASEQLRSISDSGKAPSYGMKLPSSGATVPGSIPGLHQGGNNSALGADLAAKQHGKK